MNTVNLSDSELREITRIGHQALDIARKNILSYYDNEVQVEYKGDATPVTVADRDTEIKLRQFLSEAMDTGFVGEEWGCENLTKDWVWIMDPIDGTKSFIRQVPLFGTLLGAYYKGIPVWGAIDMSALQKRVWAAKGMGAYLEGKPVRVSSHFKAENSCLLTGTVNTFELKNQGFAFHQLRRQFGLYRGWGDCFGYFQVLTGKAEVMCDPVVSLWDIGPLPILFEEAGGRFTDLKGRCFADLIPDLSQWQCVSDSFTALGTNALWHKKSLACFE